MAESAGKPDERTPKTTQSSPKSRSQSDDALRLFREAHKSFSDAVAKSQEQYNNSLKSTSDNLRKTIRAEREAYRKNWMDSRCAYGDAMENATTADERESSVAAYEEYLGSTRKAYDEVARKEREALQQSNQDVEEAYEVVQQRVREAYQEYLKLVQKAFATLEQQRLKPKDLVAIGESFSWVAEETERLTN